MDPWAFFVGDVLSYIAVIVFVIGVLARVGKWLSVPVPLKVPLTPGPTTYPGVVIRLAKEVFLFRSLFKGEKKLWVGAWTFHIFLLTTLIIHVINLLYHDLWSVIGYGWYEFAGYTGIILFGALVFLLARRITAQHMRYLSKLPDYFILILLMAIVFMGNYIRSFSGVDVKQVSAWLYSLIALHPIPPPSDPYFLTHVLLAELLIMYIPFSKIMHFIGIFVSPTRNQRNDGRMRRHRNPWNFPVKIMSWDEYWAKFGDQLRGIEGENEGEAREEQKSLTGDKSGVGG